jgi:hypothetical protein
MLHWEGGGVPSIGQRGQFHTIDREGLATLHIVEQLEVGINIEKGEPKIRIDTKIHLMEQLVMIMDVEPSRGHVWSPTKNDVFRYQKTIVPSTWTQDIEIF